MTEIPLASLVSQDSIFAVVALIAAVGWGALWLEQKRFCRSVSAVVWGILGGMLLSNLGVLPFQAVVYDFIWEYVLLFGLVVLLLNADLHRIFRETGRLMTAYLLGALGTVLGALAAYRLFSAMPHAAELTGIFAASYIGGSVNFMATSRALEMDAFPGVQAGALAADNLVMACYFALLFLLPQWGVLRRWFEARCRGAEVRGTGDVPMEAEPEPAMRPIDFVAFFALAGGICVLGGELSRWTDFSGDTILWATGLAVLVATVFSRPLARLRGAQTFGMFLMQIFFVVIGAGASVRAVVEVGPVVVMFLSVLLVVHLVFLLLAGWWMRLDIRELAAASNACCGGPTTAAAMALARNWRGMVVPLILCGTFGYAVANFVGVALAKWLGA